MTLVIKSREETHIVATAVPLAEQSNPCRALRAWVLEEGIGDGLPEIIQNRSEKGAKPTGETGESRYTLHIIVPGSVS